MADSEAAIIVKVFAQRITTSSVKERKKILGDLESCVTRGELPEGAIKGVMKYLVFTLGRYHDSKSRHYVVTLVTSISKKFLNSAMKYMALNLIDWAEKLKTLQPSTLISGSALVALDWVCIVLQNLPLTEWDGDDYIKLVEVLSYLVHGALAARKTTIETAVTKRLQSLWVKVENSDKVLAESLIKLSENPFILPIGGLILSQLQRKNKDLFEKFKQEFLESYCKFVIGSKTRPSASLLRSCGPILRYVSRDDMVNAVLPAIERALLRSPEVSLYSVSSLLAAVTIDVSPFAKDISKHLTTHCTSKEESLRETSVSGFSSLAKNLSDATVCAQIVQRLFAVLSGVDGKLTLTEQRLAVLSAVGRLSNHAASGASAQELTSSVAKMFIPLLGSEVHEGTLVHALEMLSLWTVKFRVEIPAEIIHCLQNMYAHKSSTSAVCYAYVQCMNSTFQGDCLEQGLQCVSVLNQTLERALNQPTQVQVLNVAVAACNMFMRLTVLEKDDDALGKFWSVLLDPEKELLINMKYLNQAPDSALKFLALTIERLLVHHPQHLTDEAAKPFYRAFVFTLTHGSYSTRKATHQCAKRLVAGLGAAGLATSLIKELRPFLLAYKPEDSFSSTIETSADSAAASASVGSQSSQNASSRVLADALLCLVSIPGVETQEAEDVAMETFLDAHRPAVTQHSETLWLELLKRLKLNPVEFINSKAKELAETIEKIDFIDECCVAAIQTLVRVSGEKCIPAILEHVFSELRKTEIMTVTREEKEIFCTPEGTLYDKSVLENATKAQDTTANMKRENKLYSYKDQVAEMELKKELERKKREKGGGAKSQEQPKLTKKQQEMVDAQLALEAEIRTRLQAMDVAMEHACAVISACTEGNPLLLRPYLPVLLHLLQTLMTSPLAAPRVSREFVHLRKSAFCNIATTDKNYMAAFAHCTLRNLRPECELSPDWSNEDLVLQVTRIIKRLNDVTKKSLYPATTFGYCFYLCRSVLRNNIGGEGLQLQCLDIMRNHSLLRSETDDNEKDELGPALLPVREMLALLIWLVGARSGKLQSIASTVLCDVARACGGGTGCGVAGVAEVQVLLDAMLAPSATVRDIALQAMIEMALILPTPGMELGEKVLQRIWVAKFDVDDNVQQLANKLWDDLGLDFPEEVLPMMVDDVIHHEAAIREAAAQAVAKGLQLHRHCITVMVQMLLAIYKEKLHIPPPVLDTFGRVVKESPPDPWWARAGVALTLGKMAESYTQDDISGLFNFFVSDGLGDRHEVVRKNMLDAAVATIDVHGKENVGELLPVFEEFLQQAPDSSDYDSVRQGVVIIMGTLAKHLEKDDPKIKPIAAKLIAALSTPSQQVQEAVANCLPPLVPAIQQDAPDLVRKLMNLLLESDSYGERKGAAYGIAGLVKGMGILSVKQLDIITKLQEAIQNKKNNKYREGALFAFEMLCVMLGRLFEPYIVRILPDLLVCFGDSNQYVREAADDTAKAVMSRLSAHGVKLVLPSLLSGLEQDSWRTKTGSIDLLGAMAFCAPKQLSSCLPSIVPKLTEVLGDSHMKVQKAGAQALKQIGSVIRNPEIQVIVPELLEALQDPTGKTTLCLQLLLETKFVHFIDAPSLALIAPVVQRAFQDRSTETRKMAAQIIGNMYSLTDQKDLAPYLPAVIPGLKASLADPVPEVRTAAARALGAMVKGMGEKGFEELVPWLKSTLVSDVSSVDRSGAAQGLAEVTGGLGVAKLKELMPGIIETAKRDDIPPHVRDGYLLMYIYLPSVFQDDFREYVGPIIPSVLQGLADESEFVRETALRAGQRVVNMYADTAVEFLLPQLETGLFSENWRIRCSSVQLLGDLLYKISGVSGKMTTESSSEDDNFGTETSQQAILRVLGREKRDHVFAGLYMGRSDTQLMVRQAALHVWKVVVSHTPKMLRDILSTLFTMLLGCLASRSYDKRQVAARTLGDLVKKLGEKVLPEIIPILERGLESDRSDQRQGVCIGLSEIIESTNRDHVLFFADSLIPTVCQALCDPLPDVREAAARTFDILHSSIGNRAIDDTLPVLLEKLKDDSTEEYALDGLKQIMIVKSNHVLPHLVPVLIRTPVNTRAIASLSSVAGESLTKHLPKILPALMTSLAEALDGNCEAEELQYCERVVLSVTAPAGIHIIINELLSATETTGPHRRAAIMILRAFVGGTRVAYSDYLPQLFRSLLRLFCIDDDLMLPIAWEALSNITKKLDQAEMLSQIPVLRQALRFALSDFKGSEMPGFCLLKKGIGPVLPIFREGILNGGQDLKESASIGLGDVIRRTSPEALKPDVLNITGPLIRVLGDRFGYSVKVAVLQTLALLLAKCGLMLKPFLPQLQTTFIKALNDPTRSVRLKAAAALEKLMVIHTRVDPLFVELHNGIKASDDNSIRETMLQALRGCIVGAGGKMNEKNRKEITATLISQISLPDDTTRCTAAACLGSSCLWLPEDELSILLNLQLFDNDPGLDWIVRHGRAVALQVALQVAAPRLCDDQFNKRLLSTLISLTQADRIPVCSSGLRGTGYLLKHQLNDGADASKDLLLALVKCMKHESNDVKLLVPLVINYIVQIRNIPAAILKVAILKVFVGPLVMGTKEKNTAVKANSEHALVQLLQLRNDEDRVEEVQQELESGMKEALKDIMKNLRKIASQTDCSVDNLDDTVLM